MRERGIERERESGLTTHASKDDEGWRKNMYIYSSLIEKVANPHTSTCILALHLQKKWRIRTLRHATKMKGKKM